MRKCEGCLWGDQCAQEETCAEYTSMVIYDFGEDEVESTISEARQWFYSEWRSYLNDNFFFLP